MKKIKDSMLQQEEREEETVVMKKQIERKCETEDIATKGKGLERWLIS